MIIIICSPTDRQTEDSPINVALPNHIPTCNSYRDTNFVFLLTINSNGLQYLHVLVRDEHGIVEHIEGHLTFLLFHPSNKKKQTKRTKEDLS